MSTKHLIRTFEEYKKLTDEEKEFFLFDTIHEIRGGLNSLLDNFTLTALEDHFDKRYAPIRILWVEKLFDWGLKIIIGGFLVALLVIVGWKAM